ncbi:EAL domain-containing protein [Novispirillum sp. DQ9]|uniref:sensor domain-containing protein n=1 Tax=Novispirillum sp. DQ9 TaxID=3398612 RepID=UPI003C797BA2
MNDVTVDHATAAMRRAAGETVLGAAPVAILAVDAQGAVVVYNAACERLLGHPAETVIGQPLEVLQSEHGGGLPLLLGGDPDAPFAGCRRFLPFCRADGHIVTLDVEVVAAGQGADPVFVAVLGEPDPFASLAGTWTEAEERLGTVASNLPGIVFQRVMQPDGSVYYPFFSSGVRDILGYEPEDMRVTRDGCLDCIHWADRDGYMERLRASARDLTPYAEEVRAISRDGTVKWLSGTLRPETMPSGDVIWDGVLIDVSDRMRAEHRLEMIMDHAADCIVTIGEEGRIESVNAAVFAVFGYAPDELIGQEVAVLMPEPHRSRHRAYLTHYLTTGESKMLGRGARELTGRHRDGHEFPIELALSEVLSDGRRLFVAIVRDITERKRTEARLHETEQRLLNIADNIHGIVFQCALDTSAGASGLRFSYASEGARDVLGLDPADLVADGSRFLDLMEPEERAAFTAVLVQAADRLEPVERDIKVINRKGEDCWLRVLSRPRRQADDAVVWEGVALDVTDRKQAEERLTFLAYYDPLTGLGNRALFGDRFAKVVAEAGQAGGVAVLSLGLDRFSIVNATLGHSTGDKVLVAAARRLQEVVDGCGALCRSGGDRFLIMLTGVTGDADIEDTVRAIQTRFEDPLTIDGQEFDLSLSVGGAKFPADGTDSDTLIMNADAALHRAKRQGAGSYIQFSAEMGQRAAQMLTMQHRLRRALDNEEFIAYFQPQVETRSGRIIGMEALVRWVSPDRGLIPPGEFIEVAEEYGLIDAMCEQVLRDSCRWNRRWQDLGLAHVPIAVNISGRQFHNTRLLLNMVESALREFALNPRYLELELTESSAMSDPENAINVVRLLDERGVASAIDDFGTGYSSLSVLKRFPIRKLKIDRSFVNDVTTDPGDAAIVCAMIAMANALNLKVVAEGVETQDQLDFLHGVGCDTLQGYYLSRPLPGADIERLFRESRPMPVPSH